MEKRVVVIVLLCVLALLAYVGYSSYDTQRAGASGQVFSSDSTRGRSKINLGGSSSAAPGSASAGGAAQPQETETIVYPPAAAPAAQAPVAANRAGGAQVTQGQQAAPTTAAGSDTISPNPPNGLTFAGSGRYQLYRQGNITWRLDTETGRSCVVFATDEEWKKPRVYKAGCGRS